MRIRVVLSALLALACAPPSATVDAGADAAVSDVGTPPDATTVDAGPVTVEAFADIGATSEGIGLGHDAAGGSVLYVGARDDRIVRVTPDGTVSDFAAVDTPVGLTVREDGAVLVCAKQPDGSGPGILLVSATGEVSVLIASGPGGEPFMLTNYVAVAPDGSLVFSDSGAGRLFRADADGANVAMVAEISYANGLAFSPDGATLYVASWDTATVHALSFDATTGAYGAPTVALDEVEHVDGLVTTSTGGLVLVTSTMGVVLADPASPADRSELASLASVALPANGVFGDSAFGEHELFLSSLGRRSIYVVHTDLAAPPSP